jgi:hypothetical protein
VTNKPGVEDQQAPRECCRATIRALAIAGSHQQTGVVDYRPVEGITLAIRKHCFVRALDAVLSIDLTEGPGGHNLQVRLKDGAAWQG